VLSETVETGDTFRFGRINTLKIKINVNYVQRSVRTAQ
jgi:hypothetical protein